MLKLHNKSSTTQINKIEKKEHFFKKAQARTVVGLSDRNLSTTDRYLRDSVIVSVYTRNIGGAF